MSASDLCIIDPVVAIIFTRDNWYNGQVSQSTWILEQSNLVWGVIYKQLKCISYSSRGWEVQDQGTCRFNIW
jgi:hypothetical protein